MTGNRWYNQVFKYWIWKETQTEGFHSKSNMIGRKIMIRIAKRKFPVRPNDIWVAISKFIS